MNCMRFVTVMVRMTLKKKRRKKPNLCFATFTLLEIPSAPIVILNTFHRISAVVRWTIRDTGGVDKII